MLLCIEAGGRLGARLGDSSVDGDALGIATAMVLLLAGAVEGAAHMLNVIAVLERGEARHSRAMLSSLGAQGRALAESQFHPYHYLLEI